MKSVIYLLKEWDCFWIRADLMGFTYDEDRANKWKAEDHYRTIEEVEEIGE